jgi:lipopolysaccharide cholinephosphotransferase
MYDKISSDELHVKLLSIIEAVIELCDKNKIEYFLIGGGCLGIARHANNLIPWDDDLDIAIWAGDIQRFLNVASELPLPFKAVIKDQNINSTIEVVDTTTTVINALNRSKLECEATGIFIDVLPMMHWPSINLIKIGERLAFLQAITPLTAYSGWWKKVLKRSFYYLGMAYVMRILFKYLYQPYAERMNVKCRAEKKGYVSAAIGREWVAYCPWNVIYPLRKERLANIILNVPNNLDAYLSIRYGKNYMEYPDSKILWKHFDYAVFNSKDSQ